jgi:hypothetical protein
MKKIYTSAKDLRSQLANQFKSLDYNQQGILRKDDFVNGLFAVTKDTVSPAGVLAIVQ